MAHYKVFKTNILANLDDLKFFRFLGELQSFRKVSEALGVSPQKVKRRIEALETQAGVLLFNRTHTGVSFTKDGEKLFQDLSDFWRAARFAEKKISQAGQTLSGEVSLSVTEGLGTFWLVPRIADFVQRNEHLTISLRADMALGRPDRGECDVAISLDRPTYPDLVIKRLGYLHVMPYASPRYIQKHGKPATISDILKHRVVEQVSEQVPFQRLEKMLGGKPEDGFAAMRTNTSAAHFWAVAKGAGIGLLPTYVRAITGRVMPIDLGFQLRRDIWVSFNLEATRVKNIREVIEFLTKCFSAKQFPWFGEEFIHPNDLDRMFAELNIDNRFEGFMDRAYALSEKTLVH